jgi:predicted P-loop ATPase
MTARFQESDNYPNQLWDTIERRWVPKPKDDAPPRPNATGKSGNRRKRAKPPAVPDFMGLACFDEQGKLVPNLASAMAALRNAPQISHCFALDEMQHAPVLRAPLPGSDCKAQAGWLPRPVCDDDVTVLQEWLQAHAGLRKIGKDTCHQAADLRARECAFHPVREYLDALKWDGRERLKAWLPYYLGADALPYVEAVGRWFFVALVARIFEPGCKQDYVLILEGPQGALKSQACRVIGGPWFSDSLPELIGGKDSQQHLAGKWLIELGELSALSRAEAAVLKAFITRQVERYRPAYGRKEVVQPRQCVFVGTTNEGSYLRDSTGNRRFWPVKTSTIDVDALAHDRDQLFAEAAHLYKTGAKWWPDADFEAEHIKPEQESRYEGDAWEESIEKFVNGLPIEEGRRQVSVLTVARDALYIETARIGVSEQRRIGAILSRLKFVRGRTKSQRFYERKEP